ncbi:hypothetical protein [Paenibacillus cymbidii]|uniref:hypothetical protein n=1 Tax=Paenibacillus cymbidii TaxID=1639034 RepID=UPI001081E2EF|nr:hypothetical protein [Paenibacillus cymbidii]
MAHAFVIEPSEYVPFENETEQLDKCKAWGLLSEKAVKTKSFAYKGGGLNLACQVVGYVDAITAVIAFDNDQKHCIHPSFLREMQAAGYSQRLASAAEKPADAEEAEAERPGAQSEQAEQAEALAEAIAEDNADAASEQAEEAALPAAAADEVELRKPSAAAPTSSAADADAGKTKGKPKKTKLQLPEDKVKMTATVQGFAMVPNHFTETDDEVVIYEAVRIEEPETDVGAAWSSHSATLKKLELAVGDKLAFEAKIAAKKLTNHPVPYKINNPSKLQKL